MEQVNLNIIPNGVKPVCHASQYDRNRQIRLNLYDGESTYSLSGTETIELNIKKTDGTVYTDEITNTSDNYLIISTTQQMTAASGDNECDIKITNGNVVIGTLNFVLNVEASPLEGGIDSVSYIYDLREQVNEIISHMSVDGCSITQYSGSLNTVLLDANVVSYQEV